MKSGRKNKSPRDTPFNGIISQMKEIDGKMIPCLIDFNGLSIYHCDTPLIQPTKRPISLLSRAFNNWRQYADCKSQKNYQDLLNMYSFDVFQMSNAFYPWFGKYKMLKNSVLFLFFFRWIKKYTEKKEDPAELRKIGLRVLFAWRKVTFSSRFINVSHSQRLIIYRKYFHIWSVQQSYNTVLNDTQINGVFDSLRVRRMYKINFFKKWKRKIKPHQLRMKFVNTQVALTNMRIGFAFDEWYEKFVANNQQIPRDRQRFREIFHLWKNNLAIKLDYKNRFNDVRNGLNKRTLLKFIRRWKHKKLVKCTKRAKAVIKLWTLVVVHKMTYYQVQTSINIRKERKYFRFMKKQTNRHNKERKRQFLVKWRDAAFILHAERLINENSRRIKSETCLMRWRMKLHNKLDDQIIEEMKREIVDRNCIRHAFRVWITKSFHVCKERNRKVRQFRKRILLIFPFIAWKNFGQLQTIRANEHLKQKLKQKFFVGFVLYRNLSIEKGREKGVLLDEKRLKKRFFRIARRIMIQKNSNVDDQMVVMLLNRAQPFLRVSRLSYI